MKTEILFKGNVNRIVWHVSFKENRKAIRKEGLIPQEFEKSRWSDMPKMYYPPAIFINNNDNYTEWFHLDEAIYFEHNLERYDIWRIDTSFLNTEWYLDQNYIKNGDYLYTKQNIPTKALTLYQLNDINCQVCHRIISGLGFGLALCKTGHKKMKFRTYAHNECMMTKNNNEFKQDLDELFLKTGTLNFKNAADYIKTSVNIPDSIIL